MSTHAAHAAAALEAHERLLSPEIEPHEPGAAPAPSAEPHIAVSIGMLLISAAIAVNRAGRGERARTRIRHDGIAIQILELVETLLDEATEMAPSDFAASAAIVIANAMPIVQPVDPDLARRLDAMRRTLTAATSGARGAATTLPARHGG